MNRIIVVEGLHDKNKILSVFPNENILVTNGTEVSEDLLMLLEEAIKTTEVIVFTDPDAPGNKIRHILNQRIPGLKHLYVPKKEAISKNKRKVGVEHATKDVIKDVLENHVLEPITSSDITQNDLYDLGLIGHNTSSQKRKLVCDFLHIGYSNGKQLLKKCHMFGVTKSQLLETVKRVG
jgi:ribonuclease M5